MNKHLLKSAALITLTLLLCWGLYEWIDLFPEQAAYFVPRAFVATMIAWFVVMGAIVFDWADSS